MSYNWSWLNDMLFSKNILLLYIGKFCRRKPYFSVYTKTRAKRILVSYIFIPAVFCLSCTAESKCLFHILFSITYNALDPPQGATSIRRWTPCSFMSFQNVVFTWLHPTPKQVIFVCLFVCNSFHTPKFLKFFLVSSIWHKGVCL